MTELLNTNPSIKQSAVEQTSEPHFATSPESVRAKRRDKKERNQKQAAPFSRPHLELPNGYNKLLLHSCCAPCSGEVMEAILASGIEFTIYFYNPNIHPLKEYLIRKEENIRFAEKFNIPFIDADYDRQNWFDRAKGMEDEPERGIRCTMCFDMRLKKRRSMPIKTASLCLPVAWEFPVGKICSKSMVAGTVRQKNMTMLNIGTTIGVKAVAHSA